MKLSEFRQLLADNPNRAFQLRLPDGDAVPESFHITEVARMRKTFIDCGGTMHDTETCQLQAWLGADEDHRLATGKLSGIMNKAMHFLPNEDIPVEIEYETNVISQYGIADASVTGDAVILRLEHKHTDCLAKELCGLPSPEKSGTAASGCGCGPGCC